MNKGSGMQKEISAREIDAWSRRLETEWTCSQFASSLQVTPLLPSELLKQAGKTLSGAAKTRMIISAALTRRRLLKDSTPLEKFLDALSEETDEWIKVFIAGLKIENISGGPLDVQSVFDKVPAVKATVDKLKEIGQKGPQNLVHDEQWEWLCPLDERYFSRDLPDDFNMKHQEGQSKHFTLVRPNPKSEEKQQTKHTVDSAVSKKSAQLNIKQEPHFINKKEAMVKPTFPIRQVPKKKPKMQMIETDQALQIKREQESLVNKYKRM